MSRLRSLFSLLRRPAIHIVLASLFIVGTAIRMWWQPILADEWDFYLAAEDWFENRQLIPHPQGYVHLLQLVFLTSSDHLAVIRIPGVISALLTVALLPTAIYSLHRSSRTRNDTVVIVAIWLYTLSPLTIQNMVLVDIDNTVLVPSLLAVLILWRTALDWHWTRSVPALAVAFVLILWFKLPTPILLIGTLFLFHLLRLEVRRVVEIIAAAAIGGLLWYVSFLIYNQLTGFTFAYFSRTVNRADVDWHSINSMLQRFPQTQGVLALWLSLPLALLVGLAIYQSFLCFIRLRSTEFDILALWSVVGIVFYGFIIVPAWGFPRYHAPYVPVFAILAAATVLPAVSRLPVYNRYAIGVLGFLCLLYALAFVGDPLWDMYSLTFSTGTSDLGARLVEGINSIVRLGAPIAVVFVAAIIVARLWKAPIGATLVATLAVCATAFMIHTTLVQVRAPYSTRYRYTYNYLDLQQAAAKLQGVAGYVLAPKDLLFYSGQPGQDIFPILNGKCPQGCLYESILANSAHGIAWTTKEQYRATELNENRALRELLERCFLRDQYGVFIVYTRQASCTDLFSAV